MRAKTRLDNFLKYFFKTRKKNLAEKIRQGAQLLGYAADSARVALATGAPARGVNAVTDEVEVVSADSAALGRGPIVAAWPLIVEASVPVATTLEKPRRSNNTRIWVCFTCIDDVVHDLKLSSSASGW